MKTPWRWQRINYWSALIDIAFMVTLGAGYALTSMESSEAAKKSADNNGNQIEDNGELIQELKDQIKTLDRQLSISNEFNTKLIERIEVLRSEITTLGGNPGPPGATGAPGIPGRNVTTVSPVPQSIVHIATTTTTSTTIPRRCIVNPKLCIVEVK